MKFIIHGYYGGINLGDELILYKILNDIRLNFKNSTINIFSLNPLYIKETYNIDSTKSSIVSNLFKLIKEIVKCDCFILGGGGMLTDWQKSSPFSWLTLPIFSILLKKKTIIYCVGVNPFKTLYGKLLLKFVLNHSSLIIVRDEYSKYCLKNVIGQKAKINTTIDPVIALNMPNNNFFNNYLKSEFRNKKVIPKKYTIGICPSAFFHIPKLWPDSFNRYIRLKNDFSNLIKFLINSIDANIFLIPQSLKYDVSLCFDIYNLLDLKYKNQTYVIENLKNPADLVDTLSNMDFLICMRFHSIILSINLAIPFVGIIYSKKSMCLLKKVNYLDKSVIVSDGFHEKNVDLNLNKLKELILKIWNNKMQIKNELIKKRKFLRKIEKRNIRLLREVLLRN